jgi:regulation of enolase protein 1 (concanavalin A-like superfamily)
MTTDSIMLPSIPTPLRWGLPPAAWNIGDDGALAITAGPRTDLFVNPNGEEVTLNAPQLMFAPDGDFMLSARVTVGFAATYDAGVLLLYAGERAWAKLCFEYSPQREPMIVSVVTQGFSDDANAYVVKGNQTFLRVSRLGRAFAFHASDDGAYWRLIRNFTLEPPAQIAAGFVAQSPIGDGCTVTFDQIVYTAERLADLRSGV